MKQPHDGEDGGLGWLSWVAAGALLTAVASGWIGWGPGLPGAAPGPDLSLWRVAQELGADWTGWVQAPRANALLGEDVVARQGYPVQAVLAAPLLDWLGWPGGVPGVLVIWMVAGGLGVTWLVGQAGMASPQGPGGRATIAGAAAGAAWMAGGATAVSLAEGAYSNLVGLALLPWLLGFWLRALRTDRRLPAVAAGAVLAASLVWAGGAPLAAILVLCVGVAPVLAAGRSRVAWRQGSTLGVSALLLALPVLAWRVAGAWLHGEAAAPLPDGTWSTGLELALSGSILSGGSWSWWPPIALVMAGSAGLVLYRRRWLGLALVATGLLFALGPRLGPLWLPGSLGLGLPAWLASLPVELLALTELGLCLGVAAVVSRAARARLALAAVLVAACYPHPARPVDRTPWPAQWSGLCDDDTVVLLAGEPDEVALLAAAVHGCRVVLAEVAGPAADPVAAYLHQAWPELGDPAVGAGTGSPGLRALGLRRVHRRSPDGGGWVAYELPGP